MHENRHFLLYRKRRQYAENHVHICALRHVSCCKMASSHRVTDLEKFHFESPRIKLRRHCFFTPCYFIFLDPCWVRGVSVELCEVCSANRRRNSAQHLPKMFFVHENASFRQSL